MSEANANQGRHANEQHAALEADQTKVGVVAVTFLAIFFVVGVLVVSVYQYFNDRIEQEIARKVLDVENPALGQLRAAEAQKLGHYQWADQKAGVVRIPVEKAAELVIEDYQKAAEAPAPPADTAGAPAAPAAEPAAPTEPGAEPAKAEPAAPQPAKAEPGKEPTK